MNSTLLAASGMELLPLDWIVIGGYFVLLACASALITRKQSGTEDYFLARHGMPAWAVAISVLATSLSAATFVGAPQQSYVGDLTYLSASIGGILGATLVALFFIPAFYRSGATTVYEQLEGRFGSKARSAASMTFMVGRVFASGARVFIAAIPTSLIAFGDMSPDHLMLAIGVLVVVGVLYTIMGGIAAVIWTDVIQTVVFVGAAGAALWLLAGRIPIGFEETLDLLARPDEQGGSKLKVLELGLDSSQTLLGFNPSSPYTLLTAIFGFTLFNMAAYGADQDLVQRMLTCKSAAKGSWSVISAIIVGLPVTFLFMAIGLLLYIFYARPDVMGVSAPEYAVDDSRGVFLAFILAEMPAGMSGLMIAGLFAAGLSSLNSALNAMSSTFVTDYYRRAHPDRSDAHYLKVGRFAVAGWGIVLGGFAVICVGWQATSGQTLIDFALSVMVFAYSGLLAIFLVALLTGRGNQTSAIAGLFAGFVLTLFMMPSFLGWLAPGTWLAELRIAFPWRMLIATAVSFLVVAAPRRA